MAWISKDDAAKIIQIAGRAPADSALPESVDADLTKAFAKLKMSSLTPVEATIELACGISMLRSTLKFTY